jgi:hypothetical protein
MPLFVFPFFCLFACCIFLQDQSFRAQPAQELNSLFRSTEGWIGADGAYSVPLSPTRSLWLFSDTWIGRIKDGKRTDATIVNNSIGLQDLIAGQSKITFVVRRDDQQKPQAFITPADGRGWYWLQAGILCGKKLYLFLAQIEKTEGSSVFSFKQVGQWLGIVDNPFDSPKQWHVQQKLLPFVSFTKERQLSFGAAALLHEGMVYLYGFEELRNAGQPDRSLVLARVKPEEIENFSSWQFYGEHGWSKVIGRLQPLADKMAPELSVHYRSKDKQFCLVYTENGLSPRILLRTAAAPAGPWSVAQILYVCPEMQQDKNLFCYAAKAHPHLAEKNEIIVTYVVNSFDFRQVARDATLYWPKFVRVTWNPAGIK